MNDASKFQKSSSNFFYLEKCCINQAGIVVDELKQKHLHSVACFIFDLGSWRFQVSAFSGNNLEDNTTCLNILLFMSHGRYCVCSHEIILAHVTVIKYVVYHTSIMIALIDAASPVANILAYSLKKVMFCVAWNIVVIKTNRNAITDTTPTITAVNLK